MKQILHWAAAIVMTALAYLSRALGGWDGALAVMFLLMGLDVISGLTVSFCQKSDKTRSGSFRSSQLFLGLSRKLLMVLLVILGTALDKLLGTSVCRLSVIGFYAANEAFSVVENAALLGVPFPKGILQSLERYQQLQNEQENGTDKP
ncbi:MAG: phage holin family protein [Clostridiales bacterium]|nr:phage holin family protein [Clostridiales bacterium]